MKSRSAYRAFTLIEMAIVLIIIGLLIGLVAPIVTDMVKREKSSATTASIEQLRDEIIGFALMNKNLPKYAGSINDLGARTDPYGNKILVPANERSGLNNAAVYYYYTDANSLCDGGKPGDLFTIKKILPGGSYSDACGNTNVECYEDIAFVISSPGRNLERQFSEPDSNNIITVYDPRVPTSDRADNLESYDDTVLYVSYNYLRSKVCTNTSNNSFNPPGSDVSFAQNIADFAGPSQGGASTSEEPHANGATVTVNVSTGTIELTTAAGQSGAGCVWYQGDDATGNCSNTNAGDGRGNGVCDWGSGVRAYFTFQLDAEAADQHRGYGGGFTFALVDGNNGPRSCGVGAPSTWDSWMGYSTNQGDLGADGGVSAPKMAVEVDTFADGSKCDPSYNHSALVYWTGDEHSNKHGAAIPAATASGVSVTPIDDGSSLAFNPTLDAASIGATCQGGSSPVGPKNTAGFASATGAGSNNRNWLEDGLGKNVRMEVYANPATPGWYNATVWMGCSNCADLTVQWEGNASHDGNGKKIHHVLHASDNSWPTIRFGWTMSAGTGTSGQTITLSNFGLKFL